MNNIGMPCRAETKKYQIILTEEQMRVTQKALEMYFRLMMGQDVDFINELVEQNFDLSMDNPKHDWIFDKYIVTRDNARETMKAVFRIAFAPKGYLEKKSDDMLIAEDIWDAIRFVRGTSKWENILHVSSEPIPEIKEVEEGDSE